MSGIYYFGYGGMVNPVSRKRRGVETVSERPAVLDDFRLTFALGGAANVVKKQGWSVHGVLMECSSQQDWEKLKSFDTGYDCLQANVFPYGSDDAVQANVFVMEFDPDSNAKLPLDKLPQERYIRVIAQGMRFHGVDSEYIDYQVMNVPYIPNRKREDYLEFPSCSGKIKRISEKEYYKKSKQMNWFLLGSRVMQLGPHDASQPFCEWVHAKFIAQPDITWTISQSFYDPDLPICETKQELTDLHVAWAENLLVDYFTQADVSVTLVHVLNNKEQPDTQRLRFSLLARRKTGTGSGMFRRKSTSNPAVESSSSFSNTTERKTFRRKSTSSTSTTNPSAEITSSLEQLDLASSSVSTTF